MIYICCILFSSNKDICLLAVDFLPPVYEMLLLLLSNKPNKSQPDTVEVFPFTRDKRLRNTLKWAETCSSCTIPYQHIINIPLLQCWKQNLLREGTNRWANTTIPDRENPIPIDDKPILICCNKAIVNL